MNKKSPGLYLNWVSILLFGLVTACIFLSLIFIFKINDIKKNVEYVYQQNDSLQEKFKALQRRGLLDKSDKTYKGTASDEEAIELYRELSNKTDETIDRILVITGTLAAIVIFLCGLISFRAPYDIDRQFQSMKNLIDEARSSVEESNCQIDILNALTEKTSYHKVRALEKIALEYPNKYKIYLILGSLYDNQKKYEKAIECYSLARKCGCSQEAYYNNIAIAYYNNSKAAPSKSIDLFSKAIANNPNDVELLTNRGAVYLKLKEYEKAKDDFEAALIYDPLYYEAYSYRAKLYTELAKNSSDIPQAESFRAQALQDIKKAIELNDEDSDALIALKKLNNIEQNSLINEKIADILHASGKYLESIDHYVKALSLYNTVDTEQIETHMIRIDQIIQKINSLYIEGAGIDLKILIGSKLSLLKYYFIRNGLRLYNLKDFEKAEANFHKARSISGADNTASINLAYMKRRGQAEHTSEPIFELLGEVDVNHGSAVMLINRALCYICGIETDPNIKKALQSINFINEDLDAAKEWWADVEVVGNPERNIVFLLLLLMGFIEDKENYNIPSMIKVAQDDGYAIPNDVVQIAENVKEEPSVC